MSHKEQKDFLNRMKIKFPKAFTNCNVLDIGSFDVNGNEKPWFDDCNFVGLDIGPGKGVDIVCSAHEYDAPNETFDTIISCECWEHNPYYKESIQNAVRMLKSGGFFIFTCATTGRPIHGTKSQDEVDKKRKITSQGNTFNEWVSMPNVTKDNWDTEYYKNITENDIKECLDLETIFSEFEFEVNLSHCDLYFWGIKK
jgi:SAM-dependent methyltransferase